MNALANALLQLCALTSGTDDDQFRMLPAVEQVVHKSINKRGFGPHHTIWMPCFLMERDTASWLLTSFSLWRRSPFRLPGATKS